MDVALPCGVRVGSGPDEPPEKGSTGHLSEIRPKADPDPVEYVKITLDESDSTTQKPGNTTASDGEIDTGHVETDPGDLEIDPGDVETDPDGVETDTGDVETDAEDAEIDTEDVETDPGNVETDPGNVETDHGDVESDLGDVEIDTGDDEEDVTVLTIDPNGVNASEEREDGVLIDSRSKLKHRRPGTAVVAKAVLDYLSDARNQLYDKIRESDSLTGCFDNNNVIITMYCSNAFHTFIL